MATEKTVKTTAQAKKSTAAPAKVGADPVAETPVKKEAKTTSPKTKTLPRVEDHMRVIVRSNQYGRLGFVNTRTKEKFFWDHINTLQDMTAGDIRDMRARQTRFLTDGWIWIEAIDEPGFEDLTDAEIYEALGLKRYFENALRPRHFEEIVDWSVETIEEKVPKMSDSTKTNVAIALNTEIRKQNLTDLVLIRAWEKALGMNLEIEALG